MGLKMWQWLFLVSFWWSQGVDGAPFFDPTALLRNVLVPADAAVGTIIYRLRASDPAYDYPMTFDIQDDATTVSVDTLNCSRFNSVCQANVVLQRRLEAGRFYDFKVTVKNVRGGRASMDCSFRATNATTPIGEIFPGAPTLLMVSESARRNTELGSLVARGNPNREKAVLLELWGSPLFSLRQRLISEKDAEGTVLLLGKLDYETKTVHHLTILANDPWTEAETDSRNIAAWPLLVAVLDEQDTPPVFTKAPPTTALDPDLQPGDVVLSVKAEDGDRGKPRDIRYGLVSEGNPFTPFFDLSEETGELRLAKPLNEIQAISHSNVPIILTVVAEEVRSSPTEPAAQSTTVRLALIAPQPTASNPRFSSTNFTVDLEENSPPGTILTIPKAEFIAQPGVLFSLTLLNNNGTFAVSPNVIEGRSKFMVKVSDNSLLDFERRRSVVCEILAKELTEGNHTASATLTVRLTDTNDNAPKFPRSEFAADIPENTQPGSSVLKVTASDVDGNDIRFRLLGTGSDHFTINPTTGVITVTQPLDSESIAAYAFQVQAEDNSGNKANATVAVNVLDVNDQSPIFEKPFYEFILNQDRRSFTFPAFVKALDKDVSAPNNDVKYEIIGVHENLTLDEVNGELRVQGVWNGKEVGVFKIRAYDGGVPTLWNECEIRIYPPDGNRKMVFIVSGRNRNKADVEQYLSGIVGADVKVDSIRDYDGYNQQGVLDVSESGGERSIVETSVNFASNSVVDLEHIRRILDTKETKDRESKVEVVKAGYPNLWWLLLTLLLLLILIALILILCCIIEGCPLYVAPKRRRKVTPDVEKLVIKDQENKSVQVAEWYGRREAWTPEHNLIEVEVDSIKRHELERGSERGEVRKMSYKNQEVGRDQLYIREGNADILRLITRGGDQQQQQQRPVTLIPEAYLIDSGKDILMKRFIDQQQTEARASAYQQNTLNRIQSEHELLEASLRQQNALLRQILSEREKDLRLETQSLPAGTQTDQNVSTQTEPLYLRPPRRQTRSDNDASDGSEEEEKYQKSRRRKKLNVKRKIRTPIQEESETEQIVAQTKTSLMRQQLKSNSSSRTKSSRSLRKEVLQEISDSLEPYTDSVEEETPRRNSETGLQRKEIASQLKSSSSHNDLTSKQKQSKRGSSRYMEWYSKKPRRAKVEGGSLETSATKVSKRQLSATQPAQRNVELPIGNGPEHPLIQHSKNRFEVVGLPNEDGDSGIALTRPTMAQKKSVFTIAYDDMQTRQLPESVSTTP